MANGKTVLHSIQIYQYICKHSTLDVPIAREDIYKGINRDGDVISFATVGRILNELVHAFEEIELLEQEGTGFIPYNYDNSNKKRYYAYNSDWSVSEIRLLSESIRTYSYIGDTQTKQLLEKVWALLPGHRNGLYLPRRYYASKTSYGSSFMYNLELLSEAVEKGCCISFVYGAYNEEKKLASRHKDPYTAEPYYILFSNGYYYLVASDQNSRLINFRIDRIMGQITLLDTKVNAVKQKTFIPNFDPLDYRDKSPVMYAGKPEKIVFKCKKFLINNVIDDFGFGAQFERFGENDVIVTVTAVAGGALQWLVQHCNHTCVLKPAALRGRLEETLKTALCQYAPDDEEDVKC